MRSLALDVGDKRIGVALSDPGGILASPLTIITRSEDQQGIAAILDLINQHQVERVIVGMPYSMDGSLGRQAKKVEAFTQELSSRADVPVEFRDERLTTVSARRLKKEAGTKKSRQRLDYDAMAAALILQGYLDEGRM